MPGSLKNRSRQYLGAINFHHVLFLNKLVPPEINYFAPYCLSNRPKIPKTSRRVRINLSSRIKDALFRSQFNQLLISRINPLFFHNSRLNNKYLNYSKKQKNKKQNYLQIPPILQTVV